MRRMLPLLLSVPVALAAGGCSWHDEVAGGGCEAIPDAPAGAEPHTLTARERRAAARVALAHPDVAAIAGGRGARVAVAGPWTTATLRPLGAGLEIAWRGGVDGSGTWPVLYYDATETLTPPYRIVRATVRFRNVTRIHVSVLARPWRVAGIYVVRGTEDVDLPAGALDGFPPQPHCD